MAEEIDNLLLEHLKALRNELRGFRNEFPTESENRMSALETATINVKREMAAGDSTQLHQVGCQADAQAHRARGPHSQPGLLPDAAHHGR